MKSLFAVIGVCFALTNAYAQSTDVSKVIYLNPEENRFYQMINQFRAELNLPQLQLHVYLQNAAKKHSDWMVSKDFLTHYGPTTNKTPFQRMEEEGYEGYTYAGENIACGYQEAVKTFRQWATSPQHLANMVNPHFRHMGIARSGTGNESCPYYWTNDLGTFSNLKADPAEITDIDLITRAVEKVSGPLDKPIQLPPDSNPPQPAPGRNLPATTPTPSPSVDATLLQCMVPYKLGKGILTFVQNTDTVITATPSSVGAGFTLQLDYLQNGQASNLASVFYNNTSVVKSPFFPMYSIFAAPNGRFGGFSIQYNSQTNQGQFDPYAASSSGASGSILCTLKTR